MKKTINILLIIVLMCSSLPTTAADKTSDKKKQNKSAKKDTTSAKKTDKKKQNKEILIKGKVVKQKQENLLLKELKKEQYRSSRTRRFEIVFFISLPVTLWITYSLMEYMVRNSNHKPGYNPSKELQTPHYIYMFSTTLLTSFYIAYQDMVRYPPEKSHVNLPCEKRVEVPVLGIKF